jgi:hypothetical protein
MGRTIEFILTYGLLGEQATEMIEKKRGTG